MKAYIHYNEDCSAGFLSHYFTVDLDDMFEGLFEDEPETREQVRNLLTQLAVIAENVPDSVVFEDEDELRNAAEPEGDEDEQG